MYHYGVSRLIRHKATRKGLAPPATQPASQTGRIPVVFYLDYSQDSLSSISIPTLLILLSGHRLHPRCYLFLTPLAPGWLCGWAMTIITEVSHLELKTAILANFISSIPGPETPLIFELGPVLLWEPRWLGVVFCLSFDGCKSALEILYVRCYACSYTYLYVYRHKIVITKMCGTHNKTACFDLYLVFLA